MRQIVLDTETTGVETRDGHRIIEIGAAEIVNRRMTGQVFHRYLNPDRAIDEGAIAVHGITNADLVNEARFPEIADELLAFIKDSELIIHNAPFDVGFLEYELLLMKHPQPYLNTHCKILDTLVMARDMHPGQRNSLDALCRRYQVDNSKRDFHGALLDANLLADVYLGMTGGQGSLVLDAEKSQTEEETTNESQKLNRDGLTLKLIEPSADELKLHDDLLSKVEKAHGDKALWRQQEPG